MARKKLISDSELLGLIQTYFDLECGGNPGCLGLPQIADYIKRNGYPQYAVETLRRNKPARDLIDKLRTTGENKMVEHLTFVTLVPEEFLLTHPTMESKIEALTRLNGYYEKGFTAATIIFEENKKLRKENESLKSQCSSMNEANEKLSEKLSAAKNIIKALTEDKNAYKSYIDTYVYPEIANTLLQKAGVVSPATASKTVEQSKVIENTITGATVVNQSTGPSAAKSSVIQGMFKPFANSSKGDDN